MLGRRAFLLQLAAAVTAPRIAHAQSPGMSRANAYAFSFKTLDGGVVRLSEFSGRPILIVNVASQCGFTPQYTGLKGLQDRFGDKIAILGVPSNDFNQEPGGASEILATAKGHYGVSFPLTEKAALRGPDATPSIAGPRPNGRSTCQAGIFISTWSGATDASLRPSRPESNPWTRA